MWGSGDFSRIALGFVLVSERLCESAALRAGQSVLDVATGSGSTAGAGIGGLRIRRRRVVMRYLSPEHWLAQMRAYFGPIALFFSVLPAGERRSLAGDLLDLAHKHNVSGDGSFYAPGGAPRGGDAAQLNLVAP